MMRLRTTLYSVLCLTVGICLLSGCIEEYEADNAFIHVMGEMTFTYNVVKEFAENGYNCFASTTKRNVVEHEDGTKTSTFEFVQFRNYTI